MRLMTTPCSCLGSRRDGPLAWFADGLHHHHHHHRRDGHHNCAGPAFRAPCFCDGGDAGGEIPLHGHHWVAHHCHQVDRNCGGRVHLHHDPDDEVNDLHHTCHASGSAASSSSETCLARVPDVFVCWTC